MFFPRGKAVHENLATSYVRVDALVADLREGGFSGVVEVVLRDTDSFVVINCGKLAGVVEKRDPIDTNREDPVEQLLAPTPGPVAHTKTTLKKLAESSRLERGRVSIYGYGVEIASAVARRINAKSLYVGLSTDFTDLEKMILKLVRERDREWFVDIKTQGVPTALIHMLDGACRVFDSDDITSNDYSDPADVANNMALRRVLVGSSQPGTTFDVYFSIAAEAAEANDDEFETEAETISAFDSADSAAVTADDTGLVDSHQPEVSEEDPILGFDSVDVPATVMDDNGQSDSNQPQASGSLRLIEPKSYPEEWDLTPIDLIVEPDYQEQAGSVYNVRAASANSSGFDSVAEVTEANEIVSSPDPGWKLIDSGALESADSAGSTDGAPSSSGGEGMNEVKRLMGDIARTIEDAAQTVDRPESFSMSLRAGQLKVADRYPFLDPFAGEIEYLTGEIVFVGHASVQEFVAGMAEALKLAVQTVMKSTSYPDRFRAYVTEDLQKLLARERQGLETWGLDQVIAEIIQF